MDRNFELVLTSRFPTLSIILQLRLPALSCFIQKFGILCDALRFKTANQVSILLKIRKITQFYLQNC